MTAGGHHRPGVVTIAARDVTCVQCGVIFTGKSPHAKLCSPRCRKASSRGTPAVSSRPAVVTIPGDRTTYARVLATLEAAGRSETYTGAAALALAQRIDSSTAVMGFAPLVKELRATMDAALAGAETTKDALDELKARRDRKLAG